MKKTQENDDFIQYEDENQIRTVYKKGGVITTAKQKSIFPPGMDLGCHKPGTKLKLERFIAKPIEFVPIPDEPR